MIRRRPLFWAAITFAAALIFIRLFHLDFLPADHVARSAREGAVYLGGRVVSDVESRAGEWGTKRVNFTLKSERLWTEAQGEGGRVRGDVRVTLGRAPDPLPAYGDEIVLKGVIALPEGPSNPGGFDSRTYLAARGIHAAFIAEKNTEPKILRHHRGPAWIEVSKNIRHRLSRRISRDFPDKEADFLRALFLGERGEFDEGFQQLFIRTGTLHLLAVSGFNVGFLSLTVFFFLKPFGASKRFRLWVSLLAIWGYCALVGWQAPLLRAAVMATVFIAGRLSGRRADALNSLGLAALVILVIRPGQLFDIGFQLSFLAVFGLVAFSAESGADLGAPTESTWPRKAMRYARELCWVSFVCTVVTLPISVQNFYQVTPMAVVANMAAVPLSFLIFFAGAAYLLMVGWLPAVYVLLGPVIQGLLSLFIGILFILEKIPFGCVVVGKLGPAAWMVLTGGTFYFLADRRLGAWVRAAAVVLLCVAVFSGQDILRRMDTSLRVTVLDTGQAEGIVLRFPGGSHLLIDGGKGSRRPVVVSYLHSEGVRRLDALLVSHPQADHIGAAPAVLDAFDVRHVLESGRGHDSRLYRHFRQLATQEGSVMLETQGGQRITGFPGISATLLSPMGPSKASNLNNDSLVLKITHGTKTFLFTGDIEEPAMRALLLNNREALDSDVLKVAHHGAGAGVTGREFIQAASPEVSLISAGRKNHYGHPAPVTLEALAGVASNRVLRTDLHGALFIESDGTRLAVKTTKN